MSASEPDGGAERNGPLPQPEAGPSGSTHRTFADIGSRLAALLVAAERLGHPLLAARIGDAAAVLESDPCADGCGSAGGGGS